MAEEENNVEEAKGILDGMSLEDLKPEDLVIPYSRSVVDEAVDDKKDEEVEEEVTPPVQEEQIEYVPDPGDFVPKDYSFEVTTYDDEGNKPKAHKIASVEDWDRLMEEEPNFGSGAAMTKAMRLANKMEINGENDKAAWEAKKADYDAVATADSARAEKIQGWTKEMDYLVGKGLLPKVAKEYKDAVWEGEALKDEGVKAQVELLRFMDKENKLRAKAGIKQMESVVDVLNAMQAEKGTKPPKADDKAEGKARQAASARVASGAAAPVGQQPKGISVGHGGSLDQLGSNWFNQ